MKTTLIVAVALFFLVACSPKPVEAPKVVVTPAPVVVVAAAPVEVTPAPKAVPVTKAVTKPAKKSSAKSVKTSKPVTKSASKKVSAKHGVVNKEVQAYAVAYTNAKKANKLMGYKKWVEVMPVGVF